ncbi:MAG TPA: ATP-binding protein [Thermoanaerobaculia bacterium]
MRHTLAQLARRAWRRRPASEAERFHLLARATKDALWDWDLTTNRVWRSEMFHVLFGSTDVDDDTYEGWQRRVHPEDLERVASRVFAVLQSADESWEEQYRFRRADGTFAQVHERAYVIRDAGGRAVRMVGAMGDISVAREAEQHRTTIERLIARSASEWRGTFDSVDTPILLLDEDRKVVRVNRTAADWLGGFQQVIGMPAGEVGGGRLAEVLRRLEEDEGTKAFTHELTDDAGRIWSVRVTHRERDATDRVAIVIVAWEITEVLALQQSLQRSEQLAAMGSLVAGVAHEVRNPLFGISATVDAHEPELDQKEMTEFVVALREQVDRLTHLMTDLLEYGKPPRYALAAADLPSLLAQAIRSVRPHAARRDARIETVLPEAVPPVRADGGRILQVVENLLKNAIDYTPRGGVVRVELGADDDAVTCSVSDSGPGFDPADIPRIFYPFFTKRRGGTGLGLAIAQKIIEAHGGRITAANGAAGGAVVSFSLGRASAAEMAAEME